PETAITSVTTTDKSATPSATPAANVKWFALQKSFGPVHFERVGVQYQNGALWFLLDASLSAAGLTISLDGLAVGSGLQRFSPQFTLHGLGIDYNGGGVVEIGGAFLRTKSANTTSDSYTGTAVIKTKAATISGFGSYAELNGHSSLFVYAFLDYPLGGPAFFFVTGLAAGFGYNRKLIIPSIDKVADFPLVKEALGLDTPDKLLSELVKLQPYIPPTLGEVFLAVGIRFTTFKLIDSFALLAIEFGNRVVFNIIGLSTAIVPTPEAGKSVTPLAEVQMAWKATFDPAEGFLGLNAQLTSNSYILSRDCHLSGGFAFYSWFSGEHAGDFVQTMGGYHPAFNVPAHYPSVPRLQFNWKVTDNLTLKGDAYYALCGSALMAGGHLEATWESGDLKAWFNAGADFLIQWKPYHYDARIYVDIGVSYTFKINLLFTSIRMTISIDVGADLHIWGPDFSGHASVHLWIISFGISFGAGASQEPQPIDWPTFKASFLPAVNDGQLRDNTCSIAVMDGLVRTGNSSLLRVVDLIDAARLISKVRSGTDPLSTYLQGRLQAAAPELLSLGPEKQPTAKHLSDLVAALNQLLKESSFYQAASTANLALRKEVKALIQQHPQGVGLQGEELTRLNRMLLEAAYPSEIADSSFWVINPKHFSLSVNSAIPLKKASHIFAKITRKNNQEVAEESHEELGIREARTSFGIGSMALPASELESALTITIRRDGNLAEDDFAYAPVLKKIPAGLWGESLTPDLNGQRFFENALTGFELRPKIQTKPGKTAALNRESLQYSTDPISGAFRLTRFSPFTSRLTGDENSRKRREVLNEIGTNPQRDQLLGLLHFDLDKTIQLGSLKGDDFLIVPQIGNFSD
ncbi:MAG TPA: DUF6603 domain-containing protein, partial [Terriglobia bacterium]|nr:DUF6603 domain-containing protein [Terriglobia bacterium]